MLNVAYRFMNAMLEETAILHYLGYCSGCGCGKKDEDCIAITTSLVLGTGEKSSGWWNGVDTDIAAIFLSLDSRPPLSFDFFEKSMILIRENKRGARVWTKVKELKEDCWELRGYKLRPVYIGVLAARTLPSSCCLQTQGLQLVVNSLKTPCSW